MVDPKQASEFINTFMEQLPPGIQALNDEIKSQLQQCLQHTFQKLSLVTREEFDIQTEVLAKTRAKLDEIERLLMELR